MRFIHLLIFVTMLSNTAGAQVFKCTDSAGQTKFSDKACPLDNKASTVRIFKSPPATPAESTTPARLSPAAQAHEAKRQQRRAQSDELHQRIENTSNEVHRIRSENADQQKCAAARARMTLMAQRDPLMHKYNPDFFEFQQKESLYCGN